MANIYEETDEYEYGIQDYASDYGYDLGNDELNNNHPEIDGNQYLDSSLLW